MWMRELRATAGLLALLSLLTGGLYPAAVTGVAQGLMPRQANGSVHTARDGAPVGSRLIGQPFSSVRYLWGRPSATGGAGPYDATASSGSNFGPSNPVFADSVRARVARLRAAHPDQTDPVPQDLVTASGSGLDPHVSPAAAAWQVARIAAARGVDRRVVEAAIAASTEAPLLGIAGGARVNVLDVNLRLDGVRP